MTLIKSILDYLGWLLLLLLRLVLFVAGAMVMLAVVYTVIVAIVAGWGLLVVPVWITWNIICEAKKDRKKTKSRKR